MIFSSFAPYGQVGEVATANENRLHSQALRSRGLAHGGTTADGLQLQWVRVTGMDRMVGWLAWQSLFFH